MWYVIQGKQGLHLSDSETRRRDDVVLGASMDKRQAEKHIDRIFARRHRIKLLKISTFWAAIIVLVVVMAA